MPYHQDSNSIASRRKKPPLAVLAVTSTPNELESRTPPPSLQLQLQLSDEDFVMLEDLGGDYATVSKVQHRLTNTVMVRKVCSRSIDSHEAHINLKVLPHEGKSEIRRRIIREYQIIHHCHSEYIINFFGAFLNGKGDGILYMEYMDLRYL
jgi:mitogen-activated protein kinase kinase